MPTMKEMQAADRAHADAVCAADPRQANVLAELQRIDDQWTGEGVFTPEKPRTFAFKFWMNDAGEVVSLPLIVMTSTLRYLENYVDGLPAALSYAAQHISNPDSLPHGLPLKDEVRHAVGVMLTEADEHVAKSGFKFHALGVCSEGLSLDEQHADAERDLTPQEIAAHPDMEPCFYMSMVTVDSRVWSTVHTPTNRSYRTVGPDEPGDDRPGASILTDSLTAFVATITG